MAFIFEQFTKHVISVPYKHVPHEFELYTRDLWGWALDLLRDPYLASCMTFDATKLSKFDGEHFERFIDEPYSANAFWETQVCTKLVLRSHIHCFSE